MGFTTVPTVVVGDLWDEDDFNTYLKDNFAASVPDIFTTKGDIAVGTGSKTLSRLGVGNDAEILIADSGEDTGLKWSKGRIELGMIIIWSGAVGAIPSGWQLCDGTNGTPDLCDQFVVGAGDSYAVDATGGAATIDIRHRHDITSANTSSDGDHTHSCTITTDGTHDHDISTPIVTGNDSTTIYLQYAESLTGSEDAAARPHTHTFSSSTTHPNSIDGHSHTIPDTDASGTHSHTLDYSHYGLSATQSILPKYYALCFIQRVD